MEGPAESQDTVAAVALRCTFGMPRSRWCTVSWTLAAAEAALADEEYLQQTIAVNAQGMSDLTTGFKALGLEWIPSAGNFISVDLKQPGQPIYEDLLRKGVIVRPVANYGLPNHLRISIGTPTENQFFLKALADTLANV